VVKVRGSSTACWVILYVCTRPLLVVGTRQLGNMSSLMLPTARDGDIECLQGMLEENADVNVHFKVSSHCVFLPPSHMCLRMCFGCVVTRFQKCIHTTHLDGVGILLLHCDCE